MEEDAYNVPATGLPEESPGGWAYPDFESPIGGGPGNPIDYNAPWNVGPHESWPGYDQGGPAGHPLAPPPLPPGTFGAEPDFTNDELDRIWPDRGPGFDPFERPFPGPGFGPGASVPMPTSALEASQQFLGTPPGFNSMYDLGPFPIRNVGTSMGYQ